MIHVEDGCALELIPTYAPNSHDFLLDSGRPALPVPEYGGTGRTHDWDVSAEFVQRSPIPVFLAGGLSASNVGEAIRKVRPFGVDVCSGVRTNGELDWKKLVNFIQAVGAVDAAADRKTIKPDWASFFALAFAGSTDFVEKPDDSPPQSRGPL